MLRCQAPGHNLNGSEGEGLGPNNIVFPLHCFIFHVQFFLNFYVHMHWRLKGPKLVPMGLKDGRPDKGGRVTLVGDATAVPS